MNQLQEQEEQQQGKAIQLRRRRPPREDWPLLGPRSVLPMPGPTESECGLCPGGIMGALVSNNYVHHGGCKMHHSFYSQKDTLHSLALPKVCYRPCFLFLATIINHNHRRRHNSNCGRRLSPLFRELNTEPLTQGRKGKSPPIPNND